MKRSGLTGHPPLKTKLGRQPAQTRPRQGEPSNADRALRAAAAVEEFRRQTGTDPQDALCDLLADLLHWCDRSDQDFLTELRRALHHYEAEACQCIDWLPDSPQRS